MDGDGTDAITAAFGDAAERSPGDPVFARRLEVVARLVQRGMPVRVLQALLPDWDDAISSAARSEPPAA